MTLGCSSEVAEWDPPSPLRHLSRSGLVHLAQARVSHLGICAFCQYT